MLNAGLVAAIEFDRDRDHSQPHPNIYYTDTLKIPKSHTRGSMGVAPCIMFRVMG